jgi:hypothetical protein
MRKALVIGLTISGISGSIYLHDQQILDNLHNGFRFDNLTVTPSDKRIANLLKDKDPEYVKYIPDKYINSSMFEYLDMETLINIYYHKKFFRVRSELEKRISFAMVPVQGQVSFKDINPGLKYLSIAPIKLITPEIIASIEISNYVYSSDKKKDMITLCEHFNKMLKNPECGFSVKNAIKKKMKDIVYKNPSDVSAYIKNCNLLSDDIIDWIINGPQIKSSKLEDLKYLYYVNPDNISNASKTKIAESIYQSTDPNSRLKNLDNSWKKVVFNILPNHFFSSKYLYKMDLSILNGIDPEKVSVSNKKILAEFISQDADSIKEIRNFDYTWKKTIFSYLPDSFFSSGKLQILDLRTLNDISPDVISDSNKKKLAEFVCQNTNRDELIKIFNAPWKKCIIDSLPDNFFTPENLHKFDGETFSHEMFNKHLSNIEFCQLDIICRDGKCHIPLVWNVDEYSNLNAFSHAKRRTKIKLPPGFTGVFHNHTLRLYSDNIQDSDHKQKNCRE